MLNFPKSTEVNKFIPKQKIYTKVNISNSLKTCFVEDIEKIVWVNKLAPTTLNIDKGSSIKEIEVFHIILKNKKINEKLLQTIDKAIPYYILFVLEYENKFKLCLGYKEKTIDNTINKTNIVRYFNTEWTKEPKLEIQGNKLDIIYENFLAQLSDGLISREQEKDIKDKVKTAVEIENIGNEIKKLTTKMNNEPQLNRQVKYNRQIKELKNKIEELKKQ